MIVVSLIARLALSQETYTLDKDRSQLSFGVINFGFLQFTGYFRNFDVTFKSKRKNFEDAEIELTIDVKSINTNIPRRDDDLKTKEWFNADVYPVITFKSTRFTEIKKNVYKLRGIFTMHGITKPICFDVIFKGKILNPVTNKYSYAFLVSGKLLRKDFGVGDFPMAVGVNNEVKLQCDIC